MNSTGTRTGTRSRTRAVTTAARILVTLGLAGVALTGCTATVPMEAAPEATDPLCAEITVRLPDTIGELEKRQTDAQATGAWGEPAVVLLTCGVAVPGPSEQRCVTIDGVDWLVDDSDDAFGRFTTYGRDPAVQVIVDSEFAEATALNELATAVGVNPVDRECTVAQDFTTGDSEVLTPAP
ncbi:DUF3515 family protein [Marisediminicola sp. LYQ134]|uniref:DUF3515 family protein n=1 Tax=unclassified Marisediminicola TaxID=2618316 RepID=UPI0039834577